MKTEISDKAKSVAKNYTTGEPTGIRAMWIELRKEAGLTQADVAAVIGLSRCSVVNMDKGVQPITLDHLDKLAFHLGLEVFVEIRAKGETE